MDTKKEYILIGRKMRSGLIVMIAGAFWGILGIIFKVPLLGFMAIGTALIGYTYMAFVLFQYIKKVEKSHTNNKKIKGR